MNNIKKYFRWETSLVLILILQIIIFGILNPRFLRLNVLLYSMNDYACISIMGLFLTFVIITGGMDISGGSIMGLTSIVIGLSWKIGGVNIWMTIPIALLVGALCGVFNGFLVAYTGVQAMVVTLGSTFLFSGLALVLVGMSGASAFEGIGGIPQEFVNIANGSFFNIPNSIILFVLLAIVAYVLLHKSKFGRYVYLVGINKNTANYSGVNTKLVTMITYILSGMSAAVAGIFITSYLGCARPDLGAELTLPIVTAVVLGGTSITGGKGTIIGTALAGVIVGILKFGLQMINIPSQYISIGIGILLIIAIAIRNADFNKLKLILKKSEKSIS